MFSLFLPLVFCWWKIYHSATFLVLLDLLASCQVPVPMEKEKLPPLGRWIPPPDLGNEPLWERTVRELTARTTCGVWKDVWVVKIPLAEKKTAEPCNSSILLLLTLLGVNFGVFSFFFPEVWFINEIPNSPYEFLQVFLLQNPWSWKLQAIYFFIVRRLFFRGQKKGQTPWYLKYQHLQLLSFFSSSSWNFLDTKFFFSIPPTKTSGLKTWKHTRLRERRKHQCIIYTQSTQFLGSKFKMWLPWKLTCPLKIDGWKMYSLLKNSSPSLGDMLVFGGVVFKGGVSLKISSIHQIWSHHYVPLQSFVHGQAVQPGCLRGFLYVTAPILRPGSMYLRSTLHTDSSIFSIMMITICDVNDI